MLHASRQVLRVIFLSIGFLLFVTLSIISASTATNQQAVAGKPHQFPTTDLSNSTPVAFNATSTAGTLSSAATVQNSSVTEISSTPSAATAVLSDQSEPQSPRQQANDQERTVKIDDNHGKHAAKSANQEND